MNRRAEDNDPVLKVWKRTNPYFHVAGFIIICVFVGTLKYAKIDAYGDALASQQKHSDKQDERLDRLENHYTEIDTTLKDMRDYFHVPHHNRVDNAAINQ